MKKVKLYDTTLRDGAQAEGISFSVEDKLKIVQVLDRLGIHYIEGGWPGSNPKDELFFKRAQSLKLSCARLTAFGSTRRKNTKAASDPGLASLLATRTPVICIFGKTWDFHVKNALNTTLEENLKMISESVKYLKHKKREIIYDAEHFFDGFRANRTYALATLEAAVTAGADNVTLCDTNGNSLPHEITEIVAAVKYRFPGTSWGIHTHNDSECAVANALAALREGCELAQGTINGYGERCGNANLISIIADLKLKMKNDCVTDAQLKLLTEVSRTVSEIANMVPNDRAPYVGYSAFAHKGGVHASGVMRDSRTYEHINPTLVGNTRRILVSELAGRASIGLKAKEIKLGLNVNSEVTQKIINMVKSMEHEGYQFEGADGTFALLCLKASGKHKPLFMLKGFRVTVEKTGHGSMVSEATLKIQVDGQTEHTVAEGDGPVDALDRALRKALEKFYPNLSDMSLADFKVRVINPRAGTAAKVRVLVESRDKKEEWNTLGVSENIIEASWKALVDAVEYKLIKDMREKV